MRIDEAASSDPGRYYVPGDDGRIAAALDGRGWSYEIVAVDDGEGTAEGGWAGTIRIGPAMPQFVEWARLGDTELASTLGAEMARIAEALVTHRCDKAA